jgi:hypothetical protein
MRAEWVWTHSHPPHPFLMIASCTLFGCSCHGELMNTCPLRSTQASKVKRDACVWLPEECAVGAQLSSVLDCMLGSHRTLDHWTLDRSHCMVMAQ